MRKSLVLLGLCAATLPQILHAQEAADVVVMRRPVALPKKQMDGQPPVTTPTPSTPTPAPIPGSWEAGAWEWSGQDACTDAAPQVRTMRCTVAGQEVDASRCSGPRPETTRTVPRHDGCTFSWREGAWGAYSSQCSLTSTRSRQVDCVRSDGMAAESSACDPAAKPGATQTAEITTGCTSSWQAGEFTDPGASCSANETQTRTVTCNRDLDNVLQDDAACDPQTRPAANQTVQDYSGCDYAAAEWSAWTPSSTCSATATKTRTAQCRRSDGTMVDEEECTSRGVGLSETVSEPNYSSCSHEWRYSEFVDPGANCSSKEYQTRTATCVRAVDGHVVEDGMCDPAQRETLIRTVEDYSNCHYYWYTTHQGWGEWSSTCSANATRTREIGCFRNEFNCSPDMPGYWADFGDGSCSVRVAAASCQNSPDAGSEGYTPASGSETAAVYTSCSNSWATGEFVNPGPSCVNSETQTRAVWCRRDLDQSVQDDSACSGTARPASTQTVPDYSACAASFTWAGNDPNLGHVAGYAVGSGWGADPSVPAYHIVYGPYHRNVTPGSRTAQWSIRIDSNVGNEVVAVLDVMDYEGGGDILATRTIRKSDFASAGVAQTFEAPFTWASSRVGGGHTLEIRVQYQGAGTIVVESVGYR